MLRDRCEMRKAVAILLFICVVFLLPASFGIYRPNWLDGPGRNDAGLAAGATSHYTLSLAEPCAVECSSNRDCEDGSPLTRDVCNMPGSCESSCSNIICSIACSSNSDCDDGKLLTVDSCERPRTCDSKCRNVYCRPACTSNADCADDDAATLDICSGGGRCTATCSHLRNCGNGMCDAGESNCNCPDDCGECTGDARGLCREYACIGTACKETITRSCCGNGRCEYNENYSSCSVDCAPKNISISVTGCEAGRDYVRGEMFEIRVVIEADGIKIKDADVRAKGFFGEVKIFNDGKHNDKTAYDNIYANTVTIGKDVKKANYTINVEAEFLGTRAIAATRCSVNPSLGMVLNSNKKTYILGDNLEISGYVTRKEQGVQLPVEVKIVAGEKTVIERVINSDAGGRFYFSYHSSLLDKTGLWKISAATEDSNGNSALIENAVSFIEPGATVYLNVTVDGIKAGYARGEALGLNVTLRGSDDKPVSGAFVMVKDALAVLHQLEEISLGNYAGSITIGYDSPLGEQEWEITASKTDMNASYIGRKTIDLNVNETEFFIELLEPEKRLFLIGDVLGLKARLSYPDGRPVMGAVASAAVNNRMVQMMPLEKGIYWGEYIIRQEDSGEISILIEAADSYGNSGATNEIAVEVSGVSFLHYLRKYGLSAALLALALLISIGGAYLFYSRIAKLKMLKKREKEIIEIIKDAQRKYFKEGVMDPQEYYALINKYETELSGIRNSIESREKKKQKNK